MSSKNFNNLIGFLVIILSTINISAKSQVEKGLEAKAVDYFCNNIAIIKEKITTKSIRFSGYTFGKASNIYEVADCIGDIKLIKDSIPNGLILDSLRKVNDSNQYDRIKIKPSCSILKKHIPFNFDKYIYTLYVFNAIEYHDYRYVQLLLVNKNQQNWTFTVRFDKTTNQAIDHCLAGVIY